MWVASSGSSGTWMRTGAGATYAVGALAALLAAIVGICVNIPTANRLGRLAAMKQGAASSPTPSSDSGVILARRLALGTSAVAILLLAALSAMAVARYMDCLAKPAPVRDTTEDHTECWSCGPIASVAIATFLPNRRKR